MKKINYLMSGFILTITLSLFIVKNVHAQYSSALGLRIGGTTGVSGKYFFKPTKAAEGIIGWYGNGFSLTGLIEKYTPVYNAEGLYIYYGGGAHIAFYNGEPRYYSHFGREIDYYRNNDVGFGINGIVGIEYRLPEDIPIAITLDLKPFIELGTGGYVAFAPDPSIGIRFIIH
jgi:hypothetical protein